MGSQSLWALGMLRLYALDDKMLLKIFSVEKDKWISIWNLSKIVGGWGREKKTVFKIIPPVVFLKGLLTSLLGDPHPDSEPLCGGWAVSQHLSRPWCWSEKRPCDQERSGAWGRGCGPKVWHPRKGDISSAKIRNQTKSRGGCSHSPYQPRGASPVVERWTQGHTSSFGQWTQFSPVSENPDHSFWAQSHSVFSNNKSWAFGFWGQQDRKMMKWQRARRGINETNFPTERLLIWKVINSQQRAMIFHNDDRMKCIIFY